MAKTLLFGFMLSLSVTHHLTAGNSNADSYANVYQNPNNLNHNETTTANIDPDVTFTVYNRIKLKGSSITLSDTDNRLQSVFMQNVSTKFITHGWLVSETSRSVADIREAYLRTEDVNIVTVGWSSVSQNEYAITTFRVAAVGVAIGKIIIRLLERGLVILNNIHLIGHSLGAHVMGIAGGFVRDSGYGKVGRVTGLDAAKPGFELTRAENLRLDSEDGQFVDSIHSCIEIFGYTEPIGHADFYPNGGFCSQPGCGLTSNIVFCGHMRAFEYFEESIYNANAFPAVRCNSYINYELQQCQNGQVSYMGNPTPLSTRGTFYLKTFSEPPYGKRHSSY